MKQFESENEKIIQQLYCAIEDKDFKGYMDLIADNIEFHAAGDGPVSGVHKGKENLMKIAKITYTETNGTHTVKLKQLISNNTYVAAIDTWTAQRKGKEIQMDNLLIYKIESGKVTEIREFIGDERQHDEFWK